MLSAYDVQQATAEQAGTMQGFVPVVVPSLHCRQLRAERRIPFPTNLGKLSGVSM